MKLSILSNVNLDMLVEILSKKNQVYKIPGFNQWEQISIDSSHSLIEFNPQIIFLILDADYLIHNIFDTSHITETIDSVINKIINLSKLYNKAKIYISNLDFRSIEIKELDSVSTQYDIISYWNKSLDSLIKVNYNLHLFDLYKLVHDLGRSNFYSSKMWYLASMPYSLEAIKILANRVEKTIFNILHVRKKVLVLDLDNTLWGGVLGEEGAHGIVIGESGKGLIYKDTQLLLKNIKNTGVLLTIVSKNNYSDVEHAFEVNKHMILSLNDFVSIKCNWEPKSKNIIDISNELNLGLESFVFLDDNPLEREEVRLSISEITIADFPEKIENYPSTIEKMYYDHFFLDSLTNEDLEKSDQYIAESKRVQIQKNSSTLDDFIKSLDIEVNLFHASDSNIQRISQLTQKTNQFNLVTNRYSVEELRSYMDDGNEIIAADVKDRFGNSGLVFVLMINFKDDIAEIDNMLMSCRVMGKKIENSIMKCVEDYLFLKGVKVIKAQYKPTNKNIPVENLMERLNYDVVDSLSDGTKKYIKNLNDSKQIEVIFDSKWREL